MTFAPELVSATTTHIRRGGIRNAFRYRMDFVLIEPDSDAHGPALFSRNRFNLMSVHDVDHGGAWKTGRGSDWAREVLTSHGLAPSGVRLLLLTQPRFLGYVFNPVSFWLAYRGDDLLAVIAEVSTPFKDRHSYLCHAAQFAPITADTRITKPKSLHVSPFQKVEGEYSFRFDVAKHRLAISILHKNAAQGVVANLVGERGRMTNRRLLAVSLRRPMGALRTITLIYWQALKLKLKGAPYRTRPAPPKTEVT